jgi:hypothetical protein
MINQYKIHVPNAQPDDLWALSMDAQQTCVSSKSQGLWDGTWAPEIGSQKPHAGHKHIDFGIEHF